jgi:hypothetical protein
MKPDNMALLAFALAVFVMIIQLMSLYDRLF